MKDFEVLFAGFGGQGILFSGKVIAYAGLIEDREVSWLPSYGPEMRGGTANCSVCLSSDPIASPLITSPEILVAMNLPSYEKFIDSVKPGAKVFIDSSLIQRDGEGRDIELFAIPATSYAAEKGLSGLANMIMVGKLLKETSFASYASVEAAVKKCVSAKRQALVEKNIEAIRLGYEM